MLTNDFGFSEHEIHTFFSGHRGYHIHVENEAARSLDSMARKEIIDYVCGTGLSLFDKRGEEPVSKGKGKKKRSIPAFNLNDYGWKQRLKTGMREFIKLANREDLAEVGLTTKTITIILNKKEAILSRCLEDNLWDSIPGVGVETWTKIA
jgi:DNA primase catalytic subunit